MIGIHTSFSVDESSSRLDKWLADALQEEGYDASRTQVQQWLTEGFVTGPRPKLKASDAVAQGEVYEVAVPESEPFSIEGDDVPLTIVYEDEDVVVVDKPRGLVVHPAAGHARGTLVNGLIGRGITLSHLGGSLRPGVVHRIDKDTSGLLMLAKTDAAYHSLSLQLRDHTVQRRYLAIVHGVLGHDDGLIDAPIGRDPKNRQRMAVVGTGKPAVTHFHVLERFEKYTFVELRLETGRTHQIRVHMAYIDHPLAGDPVYGRRNTLPLEGQALHAAVLGFTHPRTEELCLFESPLPQDMSHILDELRNVGS